jgi:hypothetical protein
MDHGDAAASDDLDGELCALDEADAALRALYRLLAENPDLASENESKLKELHSKRLDLAQRVGLAMLARKRASEVDDARSEGAPAAVEATSRSGAANGAVVEEPEPEPAADETPPSAAPASEVQVPASNMQLSHWKSTVRTTGFGVGLRAAPSGSTSWTLVVRDLMERVGPIRSLETTIGVIEELDALDEVATEKDRELWARLPKNAQQVWLSVLVARTRALKELPSATPEMKARVKVIIGRYPPWAKEHAPGHVNGMQVKHEPVRGSWAQDARNLWGTLAELLGDEVVVRSPSAAKKKAKPTEHHDNDGPEIDPTWRLLPLVRERRAIILGGDPREPNRERIERAFQLMSLEWPSVDGPRKVDAIVERIRRGTYDIVLVLQPFVAHKQSNAIIAATKETGVPWALVEGYGIAAVKHGLERFLGGPRGGGSPRVEHDEQMAHRG